ncbi:thyrotropin-releasing hormone receptor-like [Saccostrea cucullata]|uniref:thyrotropin-releasing hormone receptor-like n=1 Tax=Saccostrea cuccullata TaxID=36930 RepID=UPI002ED1F2F2
MLSRIVNMKETYSFAFNFSMDEYYEFLSEQHSEELLPNTILQLIAAVFGMFGNTLVLLLYGKYIQDKSGSRYFIPALAFVDLVGCLSNAVHYYLDDTVYYNYPGLSLCKTLYFLILFTGGFSAHLILVIALQRYLFICRPFGQQMTKKLRRISVSIIFLFSFGYSLPSSRLIGRELISNELISSQQVISCRSNDFSFKGHRVMIWYLGILLLFILLNIGVTSALYIPVIRVLYKSFSHGTPNDRNHRDYNANTRSEERRISDMENIDMEERPKQDVRRNNFEHCNKSIDDRNRKLKARQRITIMFLVIIIVYIASYLTTLVTQIFAFAERSVMDLKGYRLNILYFCLRFNLLNHIANPYIYWIFDIKCRQELRKLSRYCIFKH